MLFSYCVSVALIEISSVKHVDIARLEIVVPVVQVVGEAAVKVGADLVRSSSQLMHGQKGLSECFSDMKWVIW